MSRCFLFVAACLVSQNLASAQALTSASAPMRFVNPWVSAAQPNIPHRFTQDGRECRRPVQDVAQRAKAINLLNNSQFLSNVRRVPSDLKTHFTSSQGTWQIEDSSPGRNIYRWVVHKAPPIPGQTSFSIE